MNKPNIIMAEMIYNAGGGGYEDEYDMYGYGGMGEDSLSSEELGIDALMEKYKITTDDLPQYRLFLANKDVNQPKKFTDSQTPDLFRWIQSYGIYLGLKGCLPEFDKLTKEFIKYQDDEKKRDEIGESGKKELNKYEVKSGESPDESKYKSGKYYIKVMAKIIANGKEWVSKETDRLNGILSGGNLIKEKEEWFQQRLNILSVFANAINPPENKEEL